MDREKVMQALDDSLKNQHCGFIDDIGDVYAVSEETIKNIIALLKEQEAIVRCKDCKHHYYENGNIPHCDRIVYGYGWKDDDYCSRAERKDGNKVG